MIALLLHEIFGHIPSKNLPIPKLLIMISFIPSSVKQRDIYYSALCFKLDIVFISTLAEMVRRILIHARYQP